MNRLPLLMGMMLIASGCEVVQTGQQTWYKEGATERAEEAAIASAEAQAAQAHVTPAEKRDMVIRNMTAQGWRLVSKDSVPPLKSETTRPLPPPVKPGPALP